MIYLVTGEVNQGKSTWLLDTYQNQLKGDGFYNRKVYQGDCFVGQEIVHLATGESQLLSCKNGFIPDKWHEECSYSGFSFSKEGLDFGRVIVGNALFNQNQPVFIDEIGPLELEGKGFSEVFFNAIIAAVELYVVVRKKCLVSVIRQFGITEYQVISVELTNKYNQKNRCTK